MQRTYVAQNIKHDTAVNFTLLCCALLFSTVARHCRIDVRHSTLLALGVTYICCFILFCHLAIFSFAWTVNGHWQLVFPTCHIGNILASCRIVASHIVFTFCVEYTGFMSRFRDVHSRICCTQWAMHDMAFCPLETKLRFGTVDFSFQIIFWFRGPGLDSICCVADLARTSVPVYQE